MGLADSLADVVGIGVKSVDPIGIGVDTYSAYAGGLRNDAGAVLNATLDAIGGKNAVLAGYAGFSALRGTALGLTYDVAGDIVGLTAALEQFGQTGNMRPLADYLTEQSLGWTAGAFGGLVGGFIGFTGGAGFGAVPGATFGFAGGKLIGPLAATLSDSVFGTEIKASIRQEFLEQLADVANPYGFQTGYTGPHTGYDTPSELRPAPEVPVPTIGDMGVTPPIPSFSDIPTLSIPEFADILPPAPPEPPPLTAADFDLPTPDWGGLWSGASLDNLQNLSGFQDGSIYGDSDPGWSGSPGSFSDFSGSGDGRVGDVDYGGAGDLGRDRDYSGGAKDYGGSVGGPGAPGGGGYSYGEGGFGDLGSTLGGPIGRDNGYGISTDTSGYNTGGYGGDPYTSGWPVILDLTGDGIQITQKASSNFFFDMAGDGYMHRTAWAGAGNGVLAIDADGDGQITDRSEIFFTDWDPTASGDMQALRNVFDTNQNAKLDAGDARWSQFRIMVTNPDGTTSLKTLDELGIQSIDLITDKTNITLPDGSTILGQASYTRTDGTTGKVADAALSYNLEGHAVQQTVTHNADGSTSIVNKMLNPDGTLAGEITGVTSTNGNTVTLSFDRNGDTVVDDVQTRTTVTNADGSKTETLTNSTVAGRLTDRTVTQTSADKTNLSIWRDSNGDTFADQTELRTSQADGTSSIVISDLSRDGTLIRQATTTVSADGLSRTVSLDLDGNGTADDREQDATVINGDGSRTQTITLRNADNSLRTQTTKTISSDGRTQSVEQDLDGDGAADLVQVTVVTVAADGSSTSTSTAYNGDASLRTSTIATVSSDGLVRQTRSDLDGDGTVDRETLDATTIHVDGSRTQTVEIRNGDGSLQARDVILKASDGRSRTTQSDSNGDGAFDRVEVISVDATGVSVATVSIYNDDGSLQSRLVSTTNETGLSRANQYDEDGDGDFDSTVTHVTVLNAAGGSTETQTTTNTDGSVRGVTVKTTSADGLSRTVQVDVDGDGDYDLTTGDATALNPDGSKTQTIAETNEDGSLRSREVIQISGDRQTTTISRDTNGDGIVDEAITSVVQADGSLVKTAAHFTTGGALVGKVVETTAASGLSATVERDFNGDGIFDLISSAETVLNADGSRTTTAVDKNADGTMRSKAVTTVSATGLSRTTQSDSNGDGVYDLTTTEGTVLNADGSRTTTRTEINSDGSIRGKATTTVNDTGLAVTVERDVNGDGVGDIVTSDVTVLNTDGSRVRTITESNADGTLRRSSVETVSDDGEALTSVSDVDGDGFTDTTVSVVTLANGDVVKTISNVDTSGQSINKTVTTTSATGLSRAEQADFNGDGVFDLSTTEVTTLNADGSRTTTRSTLNGNGSLRDSAIVSVSSAGLTKTTKIDADGDGTFETAVTDATLVNADGSRTQTVTVTNADGSLRRNTVTTISDDGETVSIRHDLNGDGSTDRTVAQLIDANGDVVETRSNLTASGALITKEVETTGANNLSWTLQRDLNGDGVFDRVHSRSTVLSADGSRTTTFTDKSYSGSGGAVASLNSSVVTTISADGNEKSYSFDVSGPSFAPDHFKRSATDVTTLNVDGSQTKTISTFNNAGTLLDRSTIIISGNGLSTTAQFDVDGNGSIDRTYTKTIAVDGAVSETTEVRSLAGTSLLKSVSTISANGLSTEKQIDTNGDNAFDRSHTTVVNSDRSVTDSWANTGAADAAKDEVVTITSADGLSKTAEVDSDGDGFVELVTTSTTTLNADGSRTSVASKTNGDGLLLSETRTTTSDDGLTVSSAFDTNGDGITDRTTTSSKVYNDDGSTTTTVSSRYADNSLHKTVVITTSADGRTTTSQIDSDGNGANDKVITAVVNPDETKSETTQYYSSESVVTSSVVRTTSADGSVTTKQWSNGVVEKIEYLAEQNGSYTWTQASGGFGSATLAYNGYGTGVGGWSSQDKYPRELADVNGDGLADIVGFAHNAINVSLGLADGSFATAIVAGNGFVVGSSWSSDNTYPRKLADVNGDGRADIVGFASGGVSVALGQSNGTFGIAFVASGQFGAGGSWSSQDAYPREVADVNGDGRADIVGFGSNGTYVSLGRADGTFGNMYLASSAYGTSTGWSSGNTSPRKLADVNGDGRADVVGFGPDGVYVSLGQADGKFGAQFLAISHYGSADGWSSQDACPRELGDINGDGRADIVGFASNGVYVSFGQADGTFSSAVFAHNGYGSSQGWTSDNTHPRKLADVNGDGWADIVGFNSDGVYVSLGSGITTSHAISLNGVDTWTSNEGGVVRTVTIDLETKKYCLELANRIYGVVFDRQMTARESETLLKYINGNALDKAKLTFDLLTSEEFLQKYEGLSNAQFVDLIHQNALDHSGILPDLSKFLSGLQDGWLTRAEAVLAIAESSENLTNGDEALAEERFPGNEAFASVHITDKALALNLVARIYGVVLDRDPTASEASGQAQSLIDGTKTAAQLIATLLASSEFTDMNGSGLSTSDFVTKLFRNALGRDPALEEAHKWISELDNSQISREDLVFAIARTTGERTVDLIAGAAGDDALSGSAGRDQLNGGAGVNHLTGGAGGDTVVDGQGTDTIHYSRGDGNDVIYASRLVVPASDSTPAQVLGADTLSLGNLNWADIRLQRVNTSGNPASAWDDLRIRVLGTGETITIHDQFKSGLTDGSGLREWGLSEIVLADGTRVSRDQIEAAATVDTQNETVRADGSRTVIQRDIAAAQAWASIRRDYTASGDLSYERTLLDDGTSQTFLYDRAGTQSWLSRQEWSDAQGRMTKAETSNDDDSRRVDLWDTANSEAWASQVDRYNAQGQHTSQTIKYDNKTRSDQVWDVANADWSTYTDFFNSSGQRTHQNGVYDNGADHKQWSTYWDTGSAHNWSTYTDYKNASGQRTIQQGTYDNNSRWNQYWDVSGQSWETYTDYINASGVRTRQSGTYDNNTTWVIVFDYESANDWTSYQQNYDTSSRRTYLTYSYDDETRKDWYWDYGSYNWSDSRQEYDASGRPTFQRVNFDNGTRTDSLWDYTSANSLKEWVINYDSSDRPISRQDKYDDGTRMDRYWDYGSYNWSDYYKKYDASGRAVKQQVNFDDGTRTDSYWDYTSANSLKEWVINYDGSDRPISRFDKYDDGRKISYYWDYTTSNDKYNWQIQYDTAGRAVFQQDIMDSGAIVEYGWDYGSTNWTRYIKNYNGASQLLNQTFYLDSGGKTYEWWDVYNNSTIKYQYQHYNAYGVIDAMSTQYDNGTWAYYVAPITVDLDGDGIDLRAADESNVKFDWDDNGRGEQTAWVGHKDGFLVIDLAANGSSGADGVINQKKEIAFTSWAQWTSSDLEALRLAFDTNDDGALDAKDERWNEFRIWQDKNQNGISDNGELRTLDEWGIKSIGLIANSTIPQIFSDNSMIAATSAVTWKDGSTTVAGDTALSFIPEALEAKTNNGQTPRIISGTGDTEELIATADSDAFVFAQRFGHDTIVGFDNGTAGDLIVFSRDTFANAVEALAAAQQVGADVVITKDDENALTLKNMMLANLSKDDFRFMA